jgi:uncharacterized protein (TIGR03067 family)
MRVCVLICVAIVCGSGVGLCRAKLDQETREERIVRLIRQLGHEKFAKREAASKELDALGAPALDALRKAATAGDPEVQRRAELLIQAITGRLRAAAAARELKKLHGTWYTISTSYRGTVTGEDRTDTITYTGNRYFQKRNGQVWAAGTFAIVDATANPKQIEFTVLVGQYKGYHFRSIFACDGDDHQICSDDGNNHRPKEFSGQAGFLRITRRLRQAGQPPERPPLMGHADLVYAVAFAADGKTLVSGSWDMTARVWDVDSGTEKATLQGHKGPIMSVAISADGKTVATASIDKTVKVWDVARGTARLTLKGHTDCVYAVAFSPDGKTLVSGSYDGTVKLWEVATGKERATLKGHDGAVYAVAVAPDGQTVASGSLDTTVRLWEMKTGKCCATLRGHSHYIWSLAFAPNGKCLASGSGIWQEQPGRPGVGHGEGEVKVWDLATRKESFSDKTPIGPVLCVAFASDSRTLAVCGPEATIKLWDSTTRKPQATLQGHTGKVNCVAFTGNGKVLASGSQDTTIRLWDMPSLKKVNK